MAARADANRVLDSVKALIAPQVVTALRHDLPEVRLRAFELLLHLDEDALRPLVDSLQRFTDPSVRGLSAILRARVAAPDAELLSGLRDAVLLADSYYAAAGIEALQRLDARDDRTIDVLLRSLTEADSAHVRGLAASSLGDWKARPVQTVPALIDLVRTDRSSARKYAAFALAEFWEFAGDSVPVFVSALHEQYNARDRHGGQVHLRTGRSWAAIALGMLRAEAAVPDLIRALGYDGHGVWSESVVALGRLGPAAAEAVPELIWTIQHEPMLGETPFARFVEYHKADVRRKAIVALGQIGEAARAAVPLLRRLSVEGNDAARLALSAIED